MVRLFLVWFISCSVQAQTSDDLMDYAWQATVEPSSSLLQKIELPLKLLNDLTDPKAADVAVFDVNGQKLPSLNRKVPVTITDQEIDLNFHRFNQLSASGQSGSLTIGEGVIDEVRGEYRQYRYQQSQPVQKVKADYIIQLNDQQISKNIKQISLQWTHQPIDTLLQVQVQTANDLDHWTTVHRNKNLYDKDGQFPEWIKIAGLPGNVRYIRITAKQSVNEFDLKKVTGHYQDRHTPELLWHSESQPLIVDPKQPSFLTFEQPFNVTASALQFILPEGYFVNGDLYASTNGFDKKRLIKSSLSSHKVNQLNQQNRTLLPLRYFKHWWFKPDVQTSVAIKVEWGYSKKEIIFINNQQGPFTLAWGNHEVQLLQDNLSSLIQNQSKLKIEEAELVTIGPITEAGGIGRLSSSPQLPWFSWLLWLLLIGTVLITARMAIALYRDMNK